MIYIVLLLNTLNFCLLCGYDDESRVFSFQNSWNISVGIDGYFTIPYDYVLDSSFASDFWVITYWK